MEQLLSNKLIQLLEDEREILDRLLDLLTEQRRLITAGKPEDFMTNLREQESLILELQGLEDKRLDVTKALAVGLRLPQEELTVNRLLEEINPGYAHRLRPLRDKLKHLVQKVLEVNRGNQYLIGRFVELVRQNIQLLFGLGAADFYVSSGKLSGGPEQSLKAVDKRI